MATSGSVDFSVTRDEIINEAAELVGVKDFEESLTAAQVTSCSRTLNMMIKNWQAKGLMMWKTKNLYVFMSAGKTYYDLGPSGDHATLSYTKTEIATAASSGDLSIDVDSVTGITDTYNIGIELNDGTLQWTTVNGAPVGTAVTITAALTDDVAVDNNVFVYQTKAQRPLFITDARLYRDAGQSELPVKIDSRNQYNSLSLKTTTGAMNQCFYDPQTTNGKLWVYPTADSVKDYLRLTARMPVEDFDASGNNPDFPQEWFLALSRSLAILIAPKFSKEMSNNFIGQTEMIIGELSGFDNDFGSVYFEVE